MSRECHPSAATLGVSIIEHKGDTMRFRSRRTLVAALIAAAVGLVAGTTALAGSGSGSSGSGSPAGALFAKAGGGPVGIADCGPLPHKPFGDPLEDAAVYLGLTQEQLVQELEGGKSLAEIATARGKSVDGLKQAMLDSAKTDLDQAVADGDLSADEAETIMSKLRSGIDDLVNGKDGFSVRVEVKGAGPGAVLGGPFETAADYLGLSVDQVTQELRAGKSLAEIAEAHGKSVAGLKQALIEAAKADLAKAVDELVAQKGLPGPECKKVIAPVAGIARAEFHVAGTR
jgi:hypothetical protein